MWVEEEIGTGYPWFLGYFLFCSGISRSIGHFQGPWFLVDVSPAWSRTVPQVNKYYVVTFYVFVRIIRPTFGFVVVARPVRNVQF